MEGRWTIYSETNVSGDGEIPPEGVEVVPAQRLSDLATAVHDWAEAHGYFDEPRVEVAPTAEQKADYALCNAYRRSQD